MRTEVCSGHDLGTFVQAVDGAIAGGLNPTVAVVFCSLSLDPGEVRGWFAQRGITVVGATMAGEVADGSVLEETCVALLMEADPTAFEIRLYPMTGAGTMFELGQQLGRFAVERFADPVVLVFASGVRSNGEPVVSGFRQGAGRAIPLFGGMAGDDLAMTNTYVFSAANASEEGVIGLVLDGHRFDVASITTNGWQPVGVAKTVTRAEANVVYTIDGQPALDVYRKYLDIEIPAGERGGPLQLLTMGVTYPLRVQRHNGTSVLRAPLFCQVNDGSMVFAGSVPEGSKVTFCIPPSVDIVETVVTEAKALHARVANPDALIMVSCIARRMALGPLAEDEVQGLYDLWHAPMAGYFSYGEIGAADPVDCDFHTESCTLIALRDRNP